MTIEHVYKKNVQSLYRYAYVRLQDKHKAENVVLETFIRFCKDFEKFRLRKIDTKIWLFSIAKKVLRDVYKQTYSSINVYKFEEPVSDDLALVAQTFDENLRRVLFAIFSGLDNDTKDVIILRLWEEMHFDDIANLLEVSTKTIKSRFFKGLDQVKIMLEKEVSSVSKENFVPGTIMYFLMSLKYEDVFQVDKLFNDKIELHILDLIKNLYFKGININMNDSRTIPNSSVVSNNGDVIVPQNTSDIKNNKKLLYLLIALLVLVLLAAIGGIIFFMNKDNKDGDSNNSTSTSSVSNTSSSTESNSSTSSNSISTSISSNNSNSSNQTTDQYENWKTYTNSRYSFKLKYPADWTVAEDVSESCDNTASDIVGGPCTQVMFKDPIKNILTVSVTSEAEKGEITPSGIGAGDLQESEPITMGGKTVAKDILVFEGKNKYVYYKLVSIDGNQFYSTFTKSQQGNEFVDYSLVDVKTENIYIADLILKSYERL